jgi:hypothetical protein
MKSEEMRCRGRKRNVSSSRRIVERKYGAERREYVRTW